MKTTIISFLSLAITLIAMNLGCAPKAVIQGTSELHPGEQIIVSQDGPQPEWLTKVPVSTKNKIFFVGFSSEANSMEACDDNARAMAQTQLSEMVGVFVNEEYGSELYTYGNAHNDPTTGEVLQDAKALISENLVKGMAVEQRWNQQVEQADTTGDISSSFNCAVLSSLSKESYDFAVNLAYQQIRATYRDITPVVKKHLDKLMKQTRKDKDLFFKQRTYQSPTQNQR